MPGAATGRRGPLPRLVGDGARAHRSRASAPPRRRRGSWRRKPGSTPLRLYNLSRVELFYQHRIDEVALVPVFAAFVAADAVVRAGSEHDRFEWLSSGRRGGRFAWPRERRALEDIVAAVRGRATRARWTTCCGYASAANHSLP